MTDGGEKTALLLLGGSSGIAIATMRGLDRPGRTFLAQYRESRETLDALAQELGHSQVIPLQAEFSNDASTDRLAEDVARELGNAGCEALDGIVVAPAPPPVSNRFHEKTWSDFASHLDVQLRAPVRLLQRFLPPMAKKRRGSVVFVLSSYTLGHPPAGLADYVTAKHAALGLMRALAAEYGSKGLRINAISPSMVETAFLEHVPRLVVEMTAEKHPLGRIATPAEIAPTICFLLSDAASYMNGANIPITGGAPA